MNRYLDKLGGRKFVLSILLFVASIAVIFLAVDQAGAAELGVLFGFWAGLAGIHSAANVAAKKYRPEEG